MKILLLLTLFLPFRGNVIVWNYRFVGQTNGKPKIKTHHLSHCLVHNFGSDGISCLNDSVYKLPVLGASLYMIITTYICFPGKRNKNDEDTNKKRKQSTTRKA